MKVLNTHAPKKVKILRGNRKPHYNKNLRKAIMKRSRLKNKANRSKGLVDIANYKKRRNLYHVSIISDRFLQRCIYNMRCFHWFS